MAYAITQSCCADASCVSACPVNCIHPAPGEAGFGTTDMLYIDPVTCIDCGACADACPVDAAKPVDQLTGPLAAYADRNRQYYEEEAGSAAPSAAPPRIPRSLPASAGPLRIAVVGTGPSAGYTVQSLLRSTDADITVIDRHPAAGGLVRYGVAPDHPATKRIGDSFARAFGHPRVSMLLGVAVGRDISHADILAHHHAVIYATGADTPRELGIPGEDLPGSIAATEFLFWCNGRPGVPSFSAGLDAQRAVVVGNGNVAIDVARLLLSGDDRLASTGIAPRARAALGDSDVSEVVLLGRRGPADAAFAPKEFLGLRQLPGLEIVIDAAPGTDADRGIAGEIAAAGPRSAAALLREVPVKDVDWAAPPAPGKRLILRFGSSPVEARGDERVEAVRVSDRSAGTRDIAAGLLIRSIGSRGVPLPGLPFDPDTGVIPNDAGRVRPGSYVVGWAKRGATGGIGANRACATETVNALIDDAAAGLLPSPAGSARAFARLAARGRRAA